jgi:hypothetical protein
MHNLGEPQDPVYHLAVPGYNFFRASFALVDKLVELPKVEVEDVVLYAAKYCEYCIAREKYWQNPPSALTLRELETIDTTLRKIIQHATGKGLRFFRNPLAMQISMLAHIHYLLICLLAMRASELRITINHMRLENESMDVKSTTNPYYVDLQTYHRDWESKTVELEVNLEQELNAVQKLIAYLEQDKEP